MIFKQIDLTRFHNKLLKLKIQLLVIGTEFLFNKENFAKRKVSDGIITIRLNPKEISIGSPDITHLDKNGYVFNQVS